MQKKNRKLPEDIIKSLKAAFEKFFDDYLESHVEVENED